MRRKNETTYINGLREERFIPLFVEKYFGVMKARKNSFFETVILSSFLFESRSTSKQITYYWLI